MALVFGLAKPLRILATREFQASIKESFHAELCAVLEDYPWLAAHYDVGVDYLRGANGTEFIFRGLRRNMSSIRSMSRIDLAIVEEAEDVPEESWRQLIPTVRAPKSEIWAIWNPRTKGSPVDKRFVQTPPDDAVVAFINYEDNPWFPDVLERERRSDRERLDPATYAHVWEGAYLENSSAQVFSGKWRVYDFKVGQDWQGPYHGLDFGFSCDPTAAVRVWIHGGRLWIEYEAVSVGLELDDTARFLEAKIPGASKYVIRADSARPESISFLRRNGLPQIVAVKKGPNSVEDGIAFLRSFVEIVIHPRCVEAIKEFRLYSYKVDKYTGDILPEPVDAFNHVPDAVRYAVEPLMRQRTWRPL
jgi:phage terminase large subunit